VKGDDGLMYLQLANNSDERAGYPSVSEYDRLLQCRASYLLSRKAMALGQVAHEQSPAADLGAKKHLANIEGPEVLSDHEREDWESCQAKRNEFIKGWLANSQEPFSSRKEQRLWLRRGIRPLLTGKPDEILRQGARGAVLDFKFGSYRVADPADNVQLSIYALLVSREDEGIQEVTVQILSPHFDFKPFRYTRAELDRLYQSVQIVINSLSDPGEPTPRCPLPVLPGSVDLSRGEERSRERSACKSNRAAIRIAGRQALDADQTRTSALYGNRIFL
jgi:hypothetical protein